MIIHRNKQNISYYTIKYGHNYIRYGLLFTDQKSLSITVYPDKTVFVRAPLNTSYDEIANRVRKRAIWILKHLDYFDRFQPLPTERRYVSGETHLYLGRQYRLKVIQSNPEIVKLRGKFLWIHTVRKNDSIRVKGLVQEWYREHAIKLLSKRLKGLLISGKKKEIPDPIVRFRRMKARWGSCSKSGTILLNTELVKAPIYCIDYVIAHEICHLRFKNHSSDFWRLLSSLIPDWQRRKEKLEMTII